MTDARFRITIESMAGTFIQADNDAAAGALMLGAARAARSLRCNALYLTRKAVVLETVNEPDTDMLQALQVLGDAYEQATTAKRQTVFEARVHVKPIAAVASRDPELDTDLADPTPKLDPGEVESMRLRAIE